jgi:hypothetical protein
MENETNNATREEGELGAQKIQTVVADPLSRKIAQSPSFQAKKKRRQSLGGRRVSFAQPRELEEVREYYKVRSERWTALAIFFLPFEKREREKGNKYCESERMQSLALTEHHPLSHSLSLSNHHRLRFRSEEREHI